MTNNEFMVWLVKGYIAKQMGLPVDWATAATSISLTLALHLEGELLKQDLTYEESDKLQRLGSSTLLKPFFDTLKTQWSWNSWQRLEVVRI